MTSIRTGNRRRRNLSIKRNNATYFRRPIPGRSWSHPKTPTGKIMVDLSSAVLRIGDGHSPLGLVVSKRVFEILRRGLPS